MSPKLDPQKRSSRFSSDANSHPKTSLSLSELLRKRRQELGLHLSRVERDTKIRREYLEYIESGNYERLADDIYARGYVKNYADYLGLETAPILLLYKKERTARARDLKLRDGGAKQKIGLTPIDSPRVVITPRTFVILCAIALVVLVLGYLGWQFNGLAAAPTLSLDKPAAETVTSNTVFLSGHVSEGADVLVNSSPIITDGRGAFREQISLVDGVNQIQVSAKNRLGKTAVLTKTYLAHLPKQSSAVTSLTPGQTTPAVIDPNAPPAAFDHVQAVVKMGDATTWLIVVADGVEIYRGTMVAHSSQTFTAAGSLKLSVGNAGTVDVILTNTLLTNKDLGKLGRDGETKRDIEFKKDTNIL